MLDISENKLIEVAKPYFDTAREGDWEHALRVVKWVKELGKDREDLNLIITAAYIHDIGWSGIAPKGKINFDEMLKLEPLANENSSKLIKEVLGRLDFSEEDTETIIRLVEAADDHRSSRDDEEIIVDADNLSKLCKEHMEQKYQPESYKGVIDTFEKEFPNRMKTEVGISLFPTLLSKLKVDLKVS